MSRRRYAYTMGGVPLPEPVEVTEDYRGEGAERSGALIMCDRFMEGQRAEDGTDIGSRAKRSAYMRAHGVADASDFSRDWYARRASERRQAPAVREADIARAFDTLSRRR